MKIDTMISVHNRYQIKINRKITKMIEIKIQIKKNKYKDKY